VASKARSEFLQRIRAFDAAAQQQQLASAGPNPVRDPARLIRNGLMIVGFATLEDFVRSRTGEVLAQIRGQATPFTDLPEGFQSATTENVVRHFPSMMPFWKRGGILLDQIQQTASSLASTKKQRYTLSALGLFGLGNVSREDLSDGLKSFGVPNSWAAINTVASRAGLPGLALQDEYGAAHGRRNDAAHQATANILQGDLQAFTMSAIAIAFGYDGLLSRAARRLSDGTMTKTSGAPVAAADLSLRFIDRVGLGWQESRESGPVVAAGGLSTLKVSARARAFASRDVIVVRPAKRVNVHWETTDLG